MSSERKRIIVIGISGASCSGKTLLAKTLKSILPRATIIHQDDFAPAPEDLPLVDRLQDWDDPPTCIIWDQFRSTLKDIRSGKSPSHESNDHLNVLDAPELDTATIGKWKKAFSDLETEERAHGVQLEWYLVEGFILYWDQAVTNALDIRLFLRVPHETLKRRREGRSVYVIQSASAAGDVWTDPPGYFDKIVYPAYVKGHRHMFEDGDVEQGDVSEEWRNSQHPVKMLVPGEGPEEVMRVVEDSCRYLVDQVKAGAGVAL
ncbi:P-loop containing nucleoside triphosphate hydrolase protein [Kockovaella imperatae]|uniref:p-loop containing nucleoside triphosphate hydrolase protein n=1 Tax=Kockovaella imperatae TaxID=4999 RepID=A0A1Y1UR34_9TREE|nr:P-loop containing nucleoside triphosphate hydrolase protein [Kockovaella imperatae]ORX40513.1 P-loop containing nucleoside triphosphate hydrolase protein [Kockovaella imperatae]